jgi:hypothetical protein
MDSDSTPPRSGLASPYEPPGLRPRDAGFIVGLLCGEGHFGGDGRQPHVTLRMHTRHRQIFEWLLITLPGSRLYGPYTHGGRSYFQWMSRGRHLEERLVPLILEHAELLDEYVWGRFAAMCERYGIGIRDQASPA